MSEIDRFTPDGRRGVDTLYRRTYGPGAVEANRLRWDWQQRRNPYQSGKGASRERLDRVGYLRHGLFVALVT